MAKGIRLKTSRFTLVAVAAMMGAAVPATSSAQSSQTGVVKNIYSRSGDTGENLVYVVLDGPRVGAPACATGNYWMLAAENSDAGKRDLAILLSARLSGIPITIFGRQVCTRWVDGEDIREIVF